MNDLENLLQEKSTAELQTSLKYRHLTDEATTIAKAILKGRGVIVPEPLPEEALEENFEAARSNSNGSFLITIMLLILWAGFGYITGQFEHGQQERLNQSVRITGILIASVWGWGALRRKK